MSKQIDERRIREIKERLRATTPGAWKVWKPNEDYFGDESPTIVSEDGKYIAQTSYDDLSNTVRDTMVSDAEFIAHAKEDIAYLLGLLGVFFEK